mgnify:CR=1 FL=1
MVKQYTPEELTQLHQVLYEILEEIVRICDKHNIPYFVIGGTAIGALYDKAILPWDDDIDIGMKREDYNKFLQIAFCRVLPRIQGTPIETDGTSQKFVGTSVRTVLIEIYYAGLKVVIFQLAISQTELRTLIGQKRQGNHQLHKTFVL